MMIKIVVSGDVVPAARPRFGADDVINRNATSNIGDEFKRRQWRRWTARSRSKEKSARQSSRKIFG